MTVLSVADVLERAADLIEPEGAWNKGSYAIDRKGNDTVSKRSAVCYCALGAIGKITRVPFDEVGFKGKSKAAVLCLAPLVGANPRMPVSGVAKFNDAPNRTQAEVVAKLREAAALAREQGK